MHDVLRFLDWFCLEGRGYQFWSGIGLALFWPITYWWHHTCQGTRWCLRLGHAHPNHGRPVCSHHFKEDLCPV